jgi:hypothetical protein
MLNFQKKKLSDKEKLVEVLVGKKDGTFQEVINEDDDRLTRVVINKEGKFEKYSKYKRRMSELFGKDLIDNSSNNGKSQLYSGDVDGKKSSNFSSFPSPEKSSFPPEGASRISDFSSENTGETSCVKDIHIPSKNSVSIIYPQSLSYSSNNQSEISSFSYRFSDAILFVEIYLSFLQLFIFF